jgi:hypothetical protein
MKRCGSPAAPRSVGLQVCDDVDYLEGQAPFGFQEKQFLGIWVQYAVNLLELGNVPDQPPRSGYKQSEQRWY